MRHLAVVLISIWSASAAVAQPSRYDVEFQNISEKCKVPREWLQMSPDGFVRLSPPETATYEDVMCVISEMKARKLPMKTAHIMNGGQPRK